MNTILTACPRNCYSTCSFQVEVDEDGINSVFPYPRNLAVPEGPCIKGLSYIERYKSPERIITPLQRMPDGTFEAITMDAALDLISKKLTFFKSKYGPQSILYYQGSGMSGLTNSIGTTFWKRFGGATTTYGNLCWPAGLESVRLTLGSVKHNVPWDMANAGLIIFWGKNPAETNVQEMIHAAAAAKRGARIIVIDPRRTATADKSHQWFRVKPGTDGALALALAKHIIDSGKQNKEFITKFVNDFVKYSSALTIGPREAESITGIPADKIIELAELIASSDNVIIAPGYGLQRYSNGGETVRSLLALSVITGNLGREGTGFNFANLQSYIFDTLPEPLSYYPGEEEENPFRRSISMAKLGVEMLTQTNPALKMIWVERGNPLTQSPDSTTVVKAFRALEFRVVVDQFMTDTAAEADLILPAKTMFEQTDVIGSYWSPYVQLKPKILASPGEVIPESEIYYRLADILKLLKDPSEELDMPAPGEESIKAWLERQMQLKDHITIEALKSGPIIPPSLERIAYSSFNFATPSGKIELCPTQLNTLWGHSEKPHYEPLRVIDQDKTLPFSFCTPNIGSRIHSQFGNLPAIKKVSDIPSVSISPHDASEREIATGDRVKISNSHGSFITTATVTPRVQRGMAVFPNGVWKGEGGSSNFVTYPMETDIGYGAAFHNARVEIEKIIAS